MVIPHIEMAAAEAAALAQLIKRLPWTSVREWAVDDQEARDMQAALEQVRKGLVEQGFHPR